MLARLAVVIFIVLISGLTHLVHAQGNSSRKAKNASDAVIDSLEIQQLEVNRVIITGNKVTRDRIILRELSLKSGDTISSALLAETLIRDKNKIYNLRLFNTVEVRSIPLSQNRIDLLVELTERWYTFPVPIFEISDRNFNEWWQNYNHDFRRVNYGVRLYQYNFRGRNETLRLTARFGFSKEFDLSYRIPNLDQKQKQGLTFNFSYNQPKNLAYFTEDHKLLFLKSQNTLKTSRGVGVTYSYRKSFYETHSIGLEYRNNTIADTIAMLNPNYYSNGETHQQFESLTYYFNSDHRDVIQYPLKGYQITAFMNKTGLGISSDVDQFEINLTYSRYMDLKNGFYLSNFTSGYLSTPQSRPYSFYNAIGYRRQFLRGYEVYVIEGPRFFLNKTTLKKRIFTHAWHLSNIPREQFRYFPLSIYIKGYADMGYVENFPFYKELQINNTLSSKYLIGAGGGVDVVTIYDTVLRFEYSFTREGTHGFFFNVKKEF